MLEIAGGRPGVRESSKSPSRSGVINGPESGVDPCRTAGVWYGIRTHLSFLTYIMRNSAYLINLSNPLLTPYAGRLLMTTVITVKFQ